MSEEHRDDRDDTTEEPAEVAPTRAGLQARIVEAIREVYDPEIPVNIYDLGLIYAVDVQDDDRVEVRMTLTSPACPVAGSLPGEVEEAVLSVPGVQAVHVELVWDPPWGPEMMGDEAKLALGFM